MTEQNQNTPASDQGQQAKTFDADGFKKEILESQLASNKMLSDSILSQVKTMLESREAAPRQTQTPQSHAQGEDELNDYAADFKELNVEGSQAKALLNVVMKAMSKQAPKIKQETKSEVEAETTKKADFDKKRAGYNQLAAEYYPDIVNPNSPLFQQTRIEWNNMTQEEQLAAAAPYLATELAAKKLGISPISLSEIKSRAAQNSTGEPGGGKKKDEGPSDQQFDFASNFGIKNKALFAEKLKLVNGNK